MSSSAKHSAIFLEVLKEASLAPTVIRYIPILILLKGETSTAVFLTVPPAPILFYSSLWPVTVIALRTISKGFLFVTNDIISNACFTILIAKHFLPLFLP